MLKQVGLAGALALATAGVWAGQAAAAPIPDAGLTGPEVVTWLQKAGYKAELTKDDDGEPLIRSATDGVNFSIFFYDCEQQRCKSIQFSAGFDLKTPLPATKINEWNKTKRYMKAWLDEEGDPHVEYDVNLNAGRTYAGLGDDYSVWTGYLPDFGEFVGW